jgi:serine/threonine-protein kinase
VELAFSESPGAASDNIRRTVTGRKLAHYEITSHLGSGGMGDVYQATDSKLGRSVAVKFLPESFVHDADRVARFEREARVLASLNHPNIAAIYGLEDANDKKFLVMELVPGETLAERISRGPIPLDESLAIAKQIVAALEAAHEKGIIHRDLKPANIKVTEDGKVKVLDFGLAKAYGEGTTSETLSNSPTMSLAATNAGAILGTAAYMSPEQARGKLVDKRADIWAFGVVFYEMLTGVKLFQSNTVADTFAAVLKEEPDFNRVPAETQRLLRWCLDKDPKRRLRDIGDARSLLEETRDSTSRPRSLRNLGMGAGVLLAAVGVAIFITAAAVWKLKPVPPSIAVKMARLSVSLEPGETIAGDFGPPMALSPDGSNIAYASKRLGESQQLYLRSIDANEAKAVPDSEEAANPFFSPDGKWVGFFSQGKLKKVRVAGGAVVSLCDAGGGLGGTWAEDGTIYFAPASLSGLRKVRENGGASEEFTTLYRDKGEVSHRWPQVLPGGKAILFTVWIGTGWDEASLQLLVLKTGERRTVVDGARTGRYVSGHLVYSRDGTDTLMSIPFDLDRLQVGSGPPVTLSESVMDLSEGGEFAISDSGILAYVEGNPHRYESRLVWVSRNGTVEPLPAPARAYQEPSISPDGSRVAICIAGPVYGIWIYEFGASTLTPLFASGDSQAPMWTLDGNRVVYRGTRKGFRNIYWRAVDGSGVEEQLTVGDNNQAPGTWWPPDGKQFIFQEVDPTTGFDLWVKHLDGDRQQQPILRTSNHEFNPHLSLSPNGRWLAYVSNESGRKEIWVQPFPILEGGKKWKVSTEGGNEPVWSRDGTELFYRDGDKMMSSKIAKGPDFSASLPSMVFKGRFHFSVTGNSAYDVSRDGRFLMVQTPESDRNDAQFHIVLNWFEELQRI